MDYNKLNSQLYQLSMPHRYPKHKPNSLDKGYLKISDWIADLCYHFEQKRLALDKLSEEEFKQLIYAHRKNFIQLKIVNIKMA